MSAVYDDNVYRAPTPNADVIWRVTPEISVRHRSPRTTVVTSYAFDAERFAKQTELSGPVVGQRGTLETQVGLSPASILAMQVGYRRGVTAADINAATGLTNVRSPASEWLGGVRLNHTLSEKTALGIGYMFTQGLYSAGNIGNHDAELLFTRRFNQRNQGILRGESRWFVFDGQRAIASEAALLGWSAALAPTATMTLEGGARYTAGMIRPEVLAALSHRSGTREISTSYAFTQSTALGVNEVVNVHSGQVDMAYRPKALQAELRAAIFSNAVAGRGSHVYSLTALLGRSITKVLQLALLYTREVQSPARDPIGQLNVRLRRNAVSAQLTLSLKP